LLVLQVIN